MSEFKTLKTQLWTLHKNSFNQTLSSDQRNVQQRLYSNKLKEIDEIHARKNGDLQLQLASQRSIESQAIISNLQSQVCSLNNELIHRDFKERF